MRGALNAAAELSELAWRLTPADQPEVAAERAVAMVEHHGRTGLTGEVDRAAAEVLPGLRGMPRGRVLRAVGEAHIWGGPPLEAVPSLQRALIDLDGDDAAAAGTHMSLAFVISQTGNDPVAVLRHATLALEAAERAGPGGPLSEALAVHAIVGWLIGDGIDEAAFTLAVELHDQRRPVPPQLHPRTLWAVVTGGAGALDEALRALFELMETARVEGTIGGIPFLGLHAVGFLVRRGRIEEARALHSELEAIATELGGSFPLMAALAGASAVFAHTGDVQKAREAARSALAVAAEELVGFALMWVLGPAAGMELALGNHAATLELLGPVLHSAPSEYAPDPAARFVVPDAIEALIQDGRNREAQDLLDPYQRQSADLGRGWTLGASLRCRALLAAAEGDLDTAGRHAAAAVTLLEAEQFPVELGRAHLAVGQVARRQRKRGAARAAFTTAAGLFADVGAVLWERRAREELDRSWSARRDREDLTDAELRVARLVVQGLTNPEVAARLFVSRRTVEATLSRTYRKLGVRSRTELARAMGELDS
ncbi:MAG: LuxR C-terminal-related transcriptional regulator [Thermoleophilia bacterium]